MEYKKLHHSQTGIAAEFYVAGELARMGYNVTFTFGNTKSIDLLIEKGNNTRAIQVKGIQRNKSLCWNLNKTKVSDNIIYILVNLHADDIEKKPEFFLLTAPEVRDLFKNSTSSGELRSYLDYNKIKKLGIYQNRWEII